MALNNSNLTGCGDEMGISQRTVHSSYPEAAKNLVEFSPRLAALFLTFNIVITILTILGNLTVISTVIFYKKLRVPANLLITSLAVADLLVGLVLQPNYVRSISGALNNSSSSCHLAYAVVVEATGFVTLTASLTNLALITLDKYIAITRPLRYIMIVTHFRVKCAIVLSWLFSIFFGIGMSLSSLVIGEMFRVLWYVYALLICTFMISLYIKLYGISKAHAVKIQAESRSFNTNIDTKTERHGMKTVAMVTITLILSFVPYIIIRVVIRMYDVSSMDQNEIQIADSARLFSFTFLLSNSTANPFIYFFRSQKLRFYSWKMVKTLINKALDR